MVVTNDMDILKSKPVISYDESKNKQFQFKF